ncbi:unnamed protein product [Bursaphelenchus xylophilus]|uniref:glucuronosyltransferase n=1 Tax=Bursaphelenchus xylophilus TaxID=6326 RepID=A0A811LIX9_BURXY|nr:unnamed protein product [Bursaphelenchus xylophilus]CAG9117049.1 unnamed protein product [Bursaphelenchus xylophilus]
MRVLTFLLLLLCDLYHARAAKILVLPAADGGSHMQSMAPYFTTLAAAGHEVHVLDTANPKPKYVYTNVTMHNIVDPENPMHPRNQWEGLVTVSSFREVFKGSDNKFNGLLDRRRKEIDALVNQNWDLVVADDIFSAHAWGIALKLKQRGVPYVLYSTSGQVASTTAQTLAYTRNPVIKQFMFPDMPKDSKRYYNHGNFFDRLTAFWNVAHEIVGFDYYLQHVMTSISRFGVDNFSWVRLHKSSSLMFTDSMNRLGWPQSEGNDLINIGSVCNKAAELVDPDLKKFIENPRSKGTIYIAFGNYANWTMAPERILNSFNGNLSTMPQLDHIRYLKWAPQAAILNHKKTRLFVTHGGLKSLKEGICSRTPLVLMPISAEQVHNAHMGLALKWGGYVNKYTITPEGLYNEMNRILTQSFYQQSIDKNAKFLVDLPLPALELAKFHTERILRARDGKVVFRRKGMDLYWYQFLYLDLISAILTFVYITYRFVNLRSSVCTMKLVLIGLFVLAALAESCLYKDLQHNDGDEWVENTYFLFRCEFFNNNTSWRVKLSGCDYNGTRYALDEEKDGRACKSLPDGRAKFILGPICDGKEEGETWDDDHFRKTCVDGLVKFIGCTTNEKVYIPLEEEKKSGLFTWRCETAPHNGVKLYPTDVEKVNSEIKAKNEQKKATAKIVKNADKLKEEMKSEEKEKELKLDNLLEGSGQSEDETSTNESSQ